MKQPERPGQRIQDPRRVYWLRVKAGLGQKELASRVGISAAQLCRIEKNRSGASIETLHKIAEVLGCDVTELMPAEANA